MGVVCRTDERRRRHKFLYYNYNNSTVGSVVDIGLPGTYWNDMGSLSSGEVTDLASIFFYLNAQWLQWNKLVTHNGLNYLGLLVWTPEVGNKYEIWQIWRTKLKYFFGNGNVFNMLEIQNHRHKYISER